MIFASNNEGKIKEIKEIFQKKNTVITREKNKNRNKRGWTNILWKCFKKSKIYLWNKEGTSISRRFWFNHHRTKNMARRLH